MRSEDTTDKRKKMNRKRWIILLSAAIGVIVLVVADMVTPVWGGQVKYYAKWAECGQQPYQKSERLLQGVGSYEPAAMFRAFRSNHTQYFCTAKEAEKTGLSSSQDTYTFPHLTDEELQELYHPRSKQ